MVVTEDAVSALHVLTVRVDYRLMETSLGMGEGVAKRKGNYETF